VNRRLVQGKTLDLRFGASEIVIEGTIPTTRRVEGPFGEFPGYMAHEGIGFFVDVNCITTRKNRLRGFLSQFPPSESSKSAAPAPKGSCAGGSDAGMDTFSRSAA